jgi:hypothetical protein
MILAPSTVQVTRVNWQVPHAPCTGGESPELKCTLHRARLSSSPFALTPTVLPHKPSCVVGVGPDGESEG